jgi:hypothetical protein
LPAPGMQDTGTTRASSPEEALVVGAPFEGRGRRLPQGLGGEARMRAEAGSERLRDGKGAEEGWPGQWLLAVVCEPLRGLRLLALGTGAVATGMLRTVLAPPGWPLREAVAVVATLTVLDGAEDRAGCEGDGGGTLQGRRGKGAADVTESGHGSSPGLRALRRS